MGLRLSQWVLRLSSLKKKKKKRKERGKKKKKTCSWTFEEGCSGWAFDSPWPCQWEEIALPADNIFHRVSSQVEPLALVISPGISLSFVCAEGEPQPYQGADVRKESVRIGRSGSARLLQRRRRGTGMGRQERGAQPPRRWCAFPNCRASGRSVLYFNEPSRGIASHGGGMSPVSMAFLRVH